MHPNSPTKLKFSIPRLASTSAYTTSRLSRLSTWQTPTSPPSVPDPCLRCGISGLGRSGHLHLLPYNYFPIRPQTPDHGRGPGGGPQPPPKHHRDNSLTLTVTAPGVVPFRLLCSLPDFFPCCR